MKPFFASLILAALLLTVGAAEAETTIVAGLGMGSCGSWTVARRDRQAFGHEPWVLGYLSGIGDVHWAKLDPLRGTDAEGVWAWVDSYCQAHVLDKIVWAGEAFVKAHPR